MNSKFLQAVRRLASTLLSLLICLFAQSQSLSKSAPTSGTVPFILDGNRVYAEFSFIRSDGSIHKALAFVDMGSPTTTVTKALLANLHTTEKRPLQFLAGKLVIRVLPSELTIDPAAPYSVGSDLKVEAMLPAGVLQKYQIAIDYRDRTLTFARPGTLKPRGIPVPLRIDKQTGLAAVDASIDGRHYAITVDNGSAYTWFSQNTAKDWLASHPDWERGVGAVGASNMMMSGDGAEASGIMLRIPEIIVEQLALPDVGALGAGAGRGFGGNLTLFDWYSKKNAVPVIGWLGGNVLKRFRLTIDYPNQTLYWLKQTEPDSHDLDQVGITLQHRNGEYVVSSIATRNGRLTVEGVEPGDKLLQVGNLILRNATWGEIYSSLHGTPGDLRNLVLERRGMRVAVEARVTAF